MREQVGAKGLAQGDRFRLVDSPGQLYSVERINQHTLLVRSVAARHTRIETPDGVVEFDSPGRLEGWAPGLSGVRLIVE